MAIRNLGEHIVLVVLPPEPQISDELKTVNDIVSKRCDFDVIVDFSRVDILTSPSICNLMILENWLRGSGHRLVLYNIGFATKFVLETVCLDTLFDFAEDKRSALAALKHAASPSH
jgi:anti-anti-sigma regulatory factor